VDAVFRETLAHGVEALRLEVAPGALALLERYADRLLAWNRKVNLTAITAPAEVAEKHLVDSLCLLPALGGARTLLDLGSGAGLPGLPLACARPGLSVVCCDSVGKKVAFVKAVAVELGLAGVRGVAARAGGAPEREGLPRCEAVVSRALSDPEAWVPLGRCYLAPGGSLLAMLGRAHDRAQLEAVGAAAGLALVGLETYRLPVSGAERAVARWVERSQG
jgi:16S rRNA (guanine527-N7)-methyltransferase